MTDETKQPMLLATAVVLLPLVAIGGSIVMAQIIQNSEEVRPKALIFNVVAGVSILLYLGLVIRAIKVKSFGPGGRMFFGLLLNAAAGFMLFLWLQAVMKHGL